MVSAISGKMRRLLSYDLMELYKSVYIKRTKTHSAIKMQHKIHTRSNLILLFVLKLGLQFMFSPNSSSIPNMI